jgi:hypothetical protein
VFVRFVVNRIDGKSGRRQGVFQAAKVLKESGSLHEADYQRLERIRDWFNENLERPTRLAVSSRPHSKAQAISWFKDSAAEHIAKMREFQEILERYGVAVQMVKARRLGYVL